MSIEINTEVIIYRSELFVGHFNIASREHVNLILLQEGVKLFGRIVKECTFDLSTMRINKLDVKKLSSLLSCSHFTPICNSCFDAPISDKGI